MNLIGPLQESSVSKITQADAEMQSQYRKYFDLIMEYDSLDGVFVNVQRVSNQLSEEPQWVPASWHNIVQRAWTQNSMGIRLCQTNHIHLTTTTWKHFASK